MAIKEILTQINEDVKDIIGMGFELTQTQSDYVPNDEDPGLTFESGKTKKAKLIETCILYADIRNSTELSKIHSKEVMARLYTTFVRSISQVAHYHGGIVRNIIGDRVMVVFPKKNCFTNAVDTAISINTLCTRILNEHFKDFELKVGIGIDYGEMKVIKTGVAKQGKERASHKNLVWIGNTANIASKLTDVANKEVTKTVYRVTRNPSNPKAWRIKPLGHGLGVLGGLPEFELVPGVSRYLTTTEAIDMSTEVFADTLIQNSSSGELSTSGGKMIKFEKKELTSKGAAILITQKVWDGYATAAPNRDNIKNKLWTYQDVNIQEYSGKVIGGDIFWTVINEITI